MAPNSRGARAAKDLLKGRPLSLPVPVEKIARKHAHIAREELPPEVSGMLIPLSGDDTGPRWAIVVNAADASVRQRFTIAHELGHLLLHNYAAPHADGRLQVRFRDEKSAEGSILEEMEANQFAAELLMPERYVKALAGKLRFDVADQKTDALAVRKLMTYARKLRVSVQALSFRIANLGMS